MLEFLFYGICWYIIFGIIVSTHALLKGLRNSVSPWYKATLSKKIVLFFGATFFWYPLLLGKVNK